ncbi:MAG: hypothetical protein R3C59_13470 [Planctomycetaceae bacterium]
MKRTSAAVLFHATLWTVCGMLAAVFSTAHGCPFCLAPGQTWAEMVAEADVVVLAELQSTDDGSTGNAPSSIVKVLRVHKGRTHLPTGKLITIPDYIFADQGATVLLKGSLQDDSRPVVNETFANQTPQQPAAPPVIRKVSAKTSTTIVWDFSEPQSSVAFDYIIQAPTPEIPAADRLIYFAAYLEHRDNLIAADAWGEFANAQYEDIVRVRQSLPVENLRTWIADPDTSPDRLGLYGMLLGLCGDASDVDFLKRQIGQPSTDNVRFGVEGLMGGLLLLAGDDGLTFLEESRLKNSATPTYECFPVIQALQFVWTYEATLFEKDRLRKSVHPLLHREDVRETVIRDLSRWQDWTAVTVMPDVYEASRQDDPRTVRAIVGFLMTCRKAPEADPATIAAADRLLTTIRQQDGGLVKAVERDLGVTP